jgi:NADH-quinone oxidoreductase subunit M
MFLLLLIALPLLTGFLVLALRNPLLVKRVAFWSAIAELVITVWVFIMHRNGGMQSCELILPWIPDMGMNFHIGADSISLLMLMITNFLFPVILYIGFKNDERFPERLYFLLLLTQSALNGVFVSMNAVVFYIFWELALIPLYFILLTWGGKLRKIITLKFFIFTLFGSLLMLVGIIVVFLHTPAHSFELADFYSASLPPSVQHWVFWLLFLAFAVKIPIFPLHTWQPDTYTVAPVQGTLILSAIMMKMGIYGAYRWLIPVVPAGVAEWSTLVIILSLTGMIYASVIALKQDDLKRLIAYSSLAHGGLMAAALFAFTELSLQGLMLQMAAHAVNVTGLFYIAHLIEIRTGTRSIGKMGGLKTPGRRLAVLFMVILLGSIALPLTNGFPGELLIITGLYGIKPIFALLAALTMILGVVYMLYMYQRVMLGEVKNELKGFSDLIKSETAVLCLISALVILFGVYPQLVIGFTESAVQSMITILNQSIK